MSTNVDIDNLKQRFSFVSLVSFATGMSRRRVKLTLGLAASIFVLNVAAVIFILSPIYDFYLTTGEKRVTCGAIAVLAILILLATALSAMPVYRIFATVRKGRWIAIGLLISAFVSGQIAPDSELINLSPMAALEKRLEKPEVFSYGLPEVAVFQGHVLSGGPRLLRKYLADNPATRLLFLNSGGGDLHVALEISRILRQHNVATYVLKSSECSSACVAMFVAGQPHMASPQATIGLHQARNATDRRPIQGSEADPYWNALSEAGVTDEVIARAKNVVSDGVWKLPPKELVDGHVVQALKPFPSMFLEIFGPERLNQFVDKFLSAVADTEMRKAWAKRVGEIAVRGDGPETLEETVLQAGRELDRETRMSE